MKIQTLFPVLLIGIVLLLGRTYYRQTQTPMPNRINVAAHQDQRTPFESIKTASYPKLDRKMFKAETAVRNTLQDHQNGLKAMTVNPVQARDHQIRKVVNAKSREWYGDTLSPFCNYVDRINSNSRRLRKVKHKIGAYIDDPYVDKLVSDIDTLEQDLKELRNTVTEHDRYAKEKEAQALRDQIAAASIAFSTVRVYHF